MNILIFTRYSTLGASSRLRSLQYLPWFEEAGIKCVLSPLIDDKTLWTFYQTGKYSPFHLIRAYWRRIKQLLNKKSFDLIWIEKEALPWLPTWFERNLLGKTPYVLDYDDAIFHNYDQHTFPVVRYLLGQRIDQLMSEAALITAGNAYLAQRAIKAGARNVEIIPTVIDLERYPLKTTTITDNDIPRIVWIGSPHTLKYLKLIEKPLATLSQKFTFKLRIINSINLELAGVDVEFVPWTETTEVASLQDCDIGIMPLVDSHWERGKCGYKLIQYMACSLPVVASPVGVNTEIVRDENGYLATTDEEWIEELGLLLSDKSLRCKMGSSGRKRVEEEFCTQQIAPKLIHSLKQVKGSFDSCVE